MQALFDTVDSDGSGCISLTEFIAGVEHDPMLKVVFLE